MINRKSAGESFLKEVSIDKASPIPLHLQIADNIKGIIVKNRIRAGYPLPYETWVAENFHINRNTVHRAYESLVAEGFLEEKKGKRGIFVAETANKKYIQPFPSVGILLNGTFYNYLKTSNQYMSEYLGGVVDRAAETQHSAMILNLPDINGNPERIDHWLEKTVSRLTGIVHLGQSFEESDSRYRKLLDYKNIPQVFVSGSSALSHISSVSGDLSSGAIALAELLKDNGHDRIAVFATYVTEKKEKYAFNYNSGFRGMKIAECFKKAGLNVENDFFIKCDETEENTRIGVKKLLSHRKHPEAFWCQNDIVALRVIKILREMGLRVPEDISVIGYDDIKEAAASTPPLTTIKNPTYTMGRYATDLLIELFENAEPGEARNVKVPTSLVIRGSVGPIKNNDLKDPEMEL